jgi:hypothetical protein
MKKSGFLSMVVLLAGIVLANAAHAQRSVSGLHIQVDNWVLIPTLFEGTVETFVALRADAPEGDNLTSMWFIRQAGSTWTTWGWSEQNKSKAVGYVKAALQIPNSEDGDWIATPIAVNPEDLPPQTMVRGVFVDDPFAEAVASAAEPNDILDFLVTIGWSAARMDIWSVICAPDVVLNSYKVAVDGTEFAIAANGGSSNALIASTFSNSISNPCGTGSCIRVIENTGQAILVSEGDPGAILLNGSADGQFLERSPIDPGHVLVEGLITNSGTLTATLLLTDGTIVQIQAGQQVAVVHTWSTCQSQCRRMVDSIQGPGGVRPIYCIDDKCYCCCWKNLQTNPPAWLQPLQNCPCQLATDQDGDFIVPDDALWSPGGTSHHPGAEFCMRSDCDSVPDGGPGQQCCYDSTGKLLTVGGGAGTPDLIAPCGLLDISSHADEDVASFEHCSRAGMLSCYLFHRPPNNGLGCTCNPPNHPHCTTPPSAASCNCP